MLEYWIPTCVLIGLLRVDTSAQTRLLMDINQTKRVTSADVMRGADGPIARIGSKLIFDANLERDWRCMVSYDVASGQREIIVDSLPRWQQFGPIATVECDASTVLFGSSTAEGPVIWKTDGTKAGTARIVSPGGYGRIQQLVRFGSRALVVAGAGSPVGQELFVYDNPQTLRVLHDDTPGPESSQPVILGVNPSGDRAVFTTYASPATSIFVTDGTSSGTIQVATVADVAPRIAWVDNRRFVMSVRNANSGDEPWVSDGTPTGTSMIADLVPGNRSSDPRNFIALGNRVYFEADDSTAANRMLYSTDGNAITPVLQFGSKGSYWTPNRYFEEPIVFGSKIIFRGYAPAVGYEIFATDGTPSGTGVMLDVDKSGSSWPTKFVVSGPFLFFFSTTDYPNEVWITRGEPQTTARVGAIGASRRSDSVRNVTAIPGGVAFIAEDDIHGVELWKASYGVMSLRRHDLYDTPGATGDSIPLHAVSCGARAIFVNSHDRQIWGSNGLASGTADLGVSNVLETHRLVSVGAEAFFLDASGTNLLKSDGTRSGTKTLLSLGWANQWYSLDAIGYGRAAFVSRSGIGITDGSYAGTRDLISRTHFYSQSANSLERVDGKFLVLEHKTLWISDGTARGTREAFRLSQVEGNLRSMQGMIPFRNGWVFTGNADATGAEPWFTDGTARGTRILRDIIPGRAASRSDAYACVVGDRAYFNANDAVHGKELWETDGTAIGTKLVVDAMDGPVGIDPRNLTAAGQRLFFTGSVLGLGDELCQFDVVTRAMSLAADIQPGRGSGFPHNVGSPFADMKFARIGNSLFFGADDGFHGREPHLFYLGATADSFGRSCHAATLRASADPHLNSSVSLRYAANESDARLHVLCFGPPSYSGSLLPGGTCRLYLDAAALQPLVSKSGNQWSHTLAIPNQANLVDQNLSWQVLSVDATGRRVESTNAVLWYFGR